MKPASGFGRELLSAQVPRAIVAGWIIAAMTVPYSFAVSSIIFTGPLLPFVTLGAGLMMFGSIVLRLLSAWTSSYRGLITNPQEIPAAVLGTVGAGVAASMAYAPTQGVFMTMVALLVVSSLVTCLVFLAIGHLRLADLFRVIPYPLTGGFFAGTGWVITLAAFSMMSGSALGWETLPRLLDTETLWKWAPGAAYGLGLVVALRRFGSVTVVLWSTVLVTGVYHLVLLVLGISPEDARAAGLLVSGIPDGGLWPPFGPGDFVQVDWHVVAEHIPMVFIVAMVALVGLIINVNALEVATGVDMDLDREFRVAGYAGMAAGAGGSSPGYPSFVVSLATWKMGAASPWTGFFTALWLCLTLVLGGTALEFLPNAVIGGTMLLVGVDLLYAWLIEARKRLGWTDYGIICFIAFAIAAFGFLEGIAIGFLTILIVFAVRMGRMEPIKSTLTGEKLRSHKIRSVPERAILLNEAHRVQIFRLQGYLFFGSAYRLMLRLREHQSATPKPSFVVLDCTTVLGFDVSAINVLAKYLRDLDENAVEAVLCTRSARLESNIARNLTGEARERVWFEMDLDHALERCEARIIAGASDELASARGALLERVAEELEGHLDRLVVFEELVERLGPWTERRAHEEGAVLAREDGTCEGLQLLVSGGATIRDEKGARVAELGPGNVLEDRAASPGGHRLSTCMVADEPCVTMSMTGAGQRVLEATEPELCLKLYRYVLSER